MPGEGIFLGVAGRFYAQAADKIRRCTAHIQERHLKAMPGLFVEVLQLP